MSLTINQTIHLGETQLKSYLNMHSDEARFDTQLLLQHVLNVNRAWLIANCLDNLPEDSYKIFEALLNRRLSGEPIAYILGYREFYGLHLKVSPNTLIPRPDTETLVTAALAKLPINSTQSILDLGTGSGAVALAIANNRSQTTVAAVDVSLAAINIAIENATNLTIQNIQFMQSDWFNALDNQQFDLIVSNPPYIKQADGHLKQGDLRFEPISALASGEDGFDDIRYIIHHSPKYLKNNAWLMLEHGYDQADDVAKLLLKNGFNQISHVKDLGDNLRVTIGCYVAA